MDNKTVENIGKVVKGAAALAVAILFGKKLSDWRNDSNNKQQEA